MTEQVNSQATRYDSIVEQTSRERAAAMAQAANEIGARVMVLANEGETFRTRPRSSRLTSREVEVKPGNIAIQTSGQFPMEGRGDFLRRAEEIQAQNAAEQAAAEQPVEKAA